MTTDEYTQKYATWTPKGVDAYHSTRRYLLTLFGGAKGGSKTVTGCRIIQTDISNYRDGLFVVMRRNYTDLKVTTKKSFDRFFPPELIVDKLSDVWKCVNNNEILWWAADPDRDQDYEKTRGLEATGIFPDEASQWDDAFYEILPTLLRRPAFHVETGEELHRYIYLTSNPVPGKNYLKRHFIDPKTRKRDGNHNFIQSLPDDNPLLPTGYIDTAFSTMDGPMLRMLRYGDWNIEESEFTIIPVQWFDPLTVRRVHDREPKGCGIDIGLGRPDQTRVWCFNDHGEIWREEIFQEDDDQYDTTVQTDRMIPLVERIVANKGRVAIDAGSVGKGIADELYRLFGSTIIPVTFGQAATEENATQGDQRKQYENRRAQIYHWARLDIEAAAKAVERGEDAPLHIETIDELTEEFENTYYIPDTASGKIVIEKKDIIKDRLKRSPDDADAFVLMNVARRATLALKIMLPTRVTNRDAGQSTTRPGRGRRRSSIDLTGYH